MKALAYYNENDPFAAAWLRELIKSGLIAPGDVDERSIADVSANDLAGYSQCHFFAGIGGWSYALRLAGWPDYRPVWTGSCPCQPFSNAGRRGGFADERHLWPEFFRIIEQCRPHTIFGEQVASKIGLAWLDLVYADLERANYAVGAVDTCAAGFGAPHIRQRLYWVANAERQQHKGSLRGCGEVSRSEGCGQTKQSTGCSTDCRLADTDHSRCTAGQGYVTPARHRHPVAPDGNIRVMGDAQRTRLEGYATHVDKTARWESAVGSSAPAGCACGLEHPCGIGRGWWETATPKYDNVGQASQRAQGEHGHRVTVPYRIAGHQPGPSNGFWSSADWIFCRDGRFRAVEPGTFPLDNGIPARVGRLRGYGNAIVPQQAQAFIEAVMEIISHDTKNL